MGRREDNKAKKRADLETAALQLFLGQGYHATSIEQVAAEAGVARGTFYLYFDDKEALFRSLVGAALDPAIDALVEARAALDVAQDSLQSGAAYQELGSSLVQTVMEYPEAILLFYREQRNPGPIGEWLRTRSSQLDSFVADMVRSLGERGLIRNIDPRFAALAIVGAIDRLVYAWLSGNEFGDPAQVAQEVVRLFGEGLVDQPTTTAS